MKNTKITFITLAFIAIVLIVFYLNSCENGPTEPIIEPGKRDYTWTIDTIQIFSNDIMDIWGSSPEDIWGVGPGGALSETIWHYDGNLWKTDEILRNISPECIYGFARNDVWIAGQNGKIWHYDGNSWTQNYQHTINGFTGLSFYDLYGINNHDLYAVGTVWFDNETRRGIILHYNGNNWEQKYLADFNSYFAKVQVGYSGECFIDCIKQDVKHNTNDTTVFYEFDGKELKDIFSDENNSVKGGWMSIVNGNPIFSISSGIYKYDNKSLAPLIRYHNPISPGAAIGRNEKDIFIMLNGVSHYNGSDIQLLYSIEYGWFFDGAIYEKDIFLLVTMVNSSNSYIYHGKLE